LSGIDPSSVIASLPFVINGSSPRTHGSSRLQPQAEAVLETLTADLLKNSEIERESLPPEQVRSSIARHLGMDIAG
jgi:hypothetical protein